jgi:MalT-like TPR region
VSYEQGDFGASRAYLEESVVHGRAVADKVETGWVLLPLARLSADEGDAASARQHLTTAIMLGRELGSREMLAACAGGLARLVAANGQPRQALHMVGGADAWFQTQPIPTPADAQADLSRVKAEARKPLGKSEAGAALAFGRALTLDQAIAIGREHGLSERTHAAKPVQASSGRA